MLRICSIFVKISSIRDLKTLENRRSESEVKPKYLEFKSKILSELES